MKQKKENNEVDQYRFFKVMSLYDRYIKGKQSLFFYVLNAFQPNTGDRVWNIDVSTVHVIHQQQLHLGITANRQTGKQTHTRQRQKQQDNKNE